MILPENWNNLESKNYGEFTNIAPGGYICQILKAEEKKSASGKQMLVIYFDIFEGEYRDFYKRQLKTSTSSDKQWKGKYHQLTQGASECYFKGFITSIEKSNQGFIFDGNENLLKNKMFGGIFAEEEYQKKDGGIATSVKIRYVTTVDKIKNNEYTVPAKKLFNLDNNTSFTSATYSTDNVLDEDDLPF